MTRVVRLKFAESNDLNVLTKKKREICEVNWVRVNLMTGILSQHISTHHFVSFKYLIILFENYTLIKLGKIKSQNLKSQTLKRKPF